MVVVLDNLDKRLRDEQLLMFEAAQWTQREFSCLVVLPLREETYDNHRDEPPLDTALKDLVFRIEPPLFQHVLQSRIQLVMKSITNKGSKLLRYELPNGMHVEYPATDQAYYLSSIMRSIFEHGLHIRRLIVGLSGRNMRRALEIFLEFCTSGHISEDEFLKIRQSKGQYVLPLSLVTTVLLRLNQRFYSSTHAYLKNLYSVDERDPHPSFFTRLLILKLLHKRMDTFGPKRLKGYEHVRTLRQCLASYGVEADAFTREIEELARGFCIISEDLRIEGLTDSDLVALSPAGLVHIQLLSDIYYLAAIAEDSWFYSKTAAEQIRNRIRDPKIHYSPGTVLYNASEVLSSLDKARERDRSAIGSFQHVKEFDELTDLEASWREVGRVERQYVPAPWVGAHVRYPVASQHEGLIKNITNFGIFVELEPGIDGLMHASKLPANFETKFARGTRIEVKVAELDHLQKRISLIFVK